MNKIIIEKVFNRYNLAYPIILLNGFITVHLLALNYEGIFEQTLLSVVLGYLITMVTNAGMYVSIKFIDKKGDWDKEFSKLTYYSSLITLLLLITLELFVQYVPNKF